MPTSNMPIHWAHVYIHICTHKSLQTMLSVNTQVYTHRHKCTYNRCTFKHVFLVIHVHTKAHT